MGSVYVWKHAHHLCAREADPERDRDAEGNLPSPGQLVVVRRVKCTDATGDVAPAQLAQAPMHGAQAFPRKNLIYGVWKKRKVTDSYVKYTSPVYWVKYNEGTMGKGVRGHVVLSATRTKIVPI